MTIGCNQEFVVSAAGFVCLYNRKFPIVQFNPQYTEVNTFYNRYLLKYEENTLYLMDADFSIEKCKIYFLVNTDNKKDMLIFSSNLRISLISGETASTSERIKNSRLFTEDYIIHFDFQLIICWKDSEEKFSVQFDEVTVLLSWDETFISSMSQSDKPVSKEEYGIKMNIHNKCLYVSVYESLENDFSIVLRFKNGSKNLVNSIKKISLESPVIINEATKDFISWEISNNIKSFTISFCLYNSKAFIPIGMCEISNSVIYCTRYAGLSLIIGNLHGSGLEIAYPHFPNALLKIQFPYLVNKEYHDFESINYVDLSLGEPVPLFNDIPNESYKNSRLEMDHKIFSTHGLLNISLTNSNEIELSIARISTFIVMKNYMEYIICSNAYSKLGSLYERATMFSPFLLECAPFSLTFMELNKKIFSHLRIILDLKISGNTHKYFEMDFSLPLDYKFHPMDNDVLIKYKRFIHNDVNILPDVENKVSLNIPFKTYYVQYMNIYNVSGDEDLGHLTAGIYSIERSEITMKLEDDTIIFIGDPESIAYSYIILTITDGLNFYTQSTRMLKISDDIFGTFLYLHGTVSWKIIISSFKFNFSIDVDGLSINIGNCLSGMSCSLFVNDFIDELCEDSIKLNPLKPIQIFTLIFEVTPIVNSQELSVISYMETIDLESDKYKPEKEVEHLPDIIKLITPAKERIIIAPYKKAVEIEAVPYPEISPKGWIPPKKPGYIVLILFVGLLAVLLIIFVVFIFYKRLFLKKKIKMKFVAYRKKPIDEIV